LNLFYLRDLESFKNFSIDKKAQDLVAISTELNSDFVIQGYQKGIFPWFEEGGFFYWFCPRVRMVVDKNSLKISRSLAKIIRKNEFQIDFNKNFLLVMKFCANTKRAHEDGTWISKPYFKAYGDVFKKGKAISVEANKDGKLVGGLYGLSIGGMFFGESMFYKESNASKVAFISLAKKMFEHCPNALIDAQVPSRHLKNLGGYELSRAKYLAKLKKSLELKDPLASFKS